MMSNKLRILQTSDHSGPLSLPRRVSKFSLWTDHVWQLKKLNPASRKKDSAIDWRMDMPDGGKLTDERWAPLLEELRRFVWSLLTDKRQGRALSNGSLGGIDTTVGVIAWWMAEEGYESLSQLDPDSGDELLDYLEQRYETQKAHVGRSKKWSFSSAQRVLSTFILIHRQRLALRKLGVDIHVVPPFDGQTAYHIVTHRLGFKRSREGLRDYDDDTFIEVMNAAVRLIGTPAEDVIALQSNYLDMCERIDGPRGQRRDRMSYNTSYDYKTSLRRLLSETHFNCISGEQQPWRGPLVPFERTMADGRKVNIDHTQLIRRAIVDIQSAAQIVIQGLGAQRASELCAVDVAPPQPGQLPSCIEVKKSLDGTMDVFYIRSPELKISKKIHRWPLGSRPSGTNYLPLPVLAIDVLVRLLEPWRILGETRKLLLTFAAAKSLPWKKTSVGSMCSTRLAQMGKEFVLAYCDTSKFSAEGYVDLIENVGFRGHRFRKTFARFVYRTNPRLLAAISSHFKHLSVAMTEQGYIGHDVEMIEAMDSERAYASARLIVSIVSGDMPALGNGGKLIKAHADELKSTIDSLPGSTFLEKTIAFVRDEEVLIWPQGDGDCLFNLKPRAAVCHRVAGTSSWNQQAPNFQARNANTCSGCSCNVVTIDHLPYWLERRDMLRAVLESNKSSPDWEAFHATRNRLAQAEALVRVLSNRKAESAKSATH